ncbi:TetR family transcriptional regulator [Glycomyces sp. TRM65418]|uniref:TetR family transcriptional regulator n=1 Tax=Glycomyces sp. TRM65418 TaxID=2867006 RepID=UPI001CE5E4B5|nr:TetR family transcriptional regulator [Glycomyces sp. TRM65418]MCC3763978.1 TetR family transcriptional regulator [Glycomyces sp. TRM65418]QZD53674.1 TetR family transcriptional regulator [Glycomyces sp. TRM65418]
MPPQEGKRSDATRRALLRAARDEFAELGLAGARVDRIAEVAGVNKERIYGIFGSKDKLFDAVIVDTMQEFTEVVDPLWKTDDVGAFVASLYDYQRTKPQLLRLLTWEALHRGDDVHDVDGWRHEHYRRKIQHSMAQFGTDDPFRAGLMTLVLYGITNWLNLAPQLRRLLLGDRANDADAIRAFLVPFAEGATKAMKPGTDPVNDLTTGAAAEPSPVEDGAGAEPDPVEAAAERLRRAQAETEAAKAALGEALRAANAAGVSANRLARQVAGTCSRPVVLKLLAE